MATLQLRRSAVMVAVSGCLSTALAAPSKDPIDDVVVTATRTEQNINEVAGSVTIITRADIERRQVQSVQDLLRGEMGIDITNQGGLGKFTSLFMRGAGSGHILVLIDGVRTGNATSGTTAFEYLPPDQVERIEIVRGPRSSIYGSDAISGVVQIFTRRAEPGISSSAGIASDDTYRVMGRFGLVNDAYWFNVVADRLQTEGYNSCRGSLTDACFVIEPDRDGFRNTSGTLRAGYRWGERAEIEFSTLYATGNSEFDGGFQNEADFRQVVPTLRSRLQVTEALTLRLTLGDSRDQVDNLYNGEFRGDFNTEKRSGTLQSDWQLTPSQLLTLGVDYIDDRVDSTTPFAITERDNTGWFGVYQARFGAHEAELSARHDDNEQFGAHTTGNVGWKWHVADSLAVLATYGSAFRAPTFNDLYYPGFSNPHLDPEKAQSYELGVSGTTPAARWSVHGFITRIDDMIDLNPSFIPENVSEARIRGLEAFGSTAFEAWRVDINYTWLDPRNRGAGPDYDKLLQRRSRHSGRIQVTRSLGAFNFGTEIRAQGPRYNDAANAVRLGSYAVADVLGEFQFAAAWSLQAKVANVFDRDYETVYLYNQPDRTYSLSVRYEPGNSK